VSGEIHVNGQPVDSLIEYQDKSAFVPQEEIMYTQLSVEECVTYAALLFNKRGYKTKKECTVMVTYLLNVLGIEFIRHTVIGNAEEKSISGGQKKRVSVAMEMVKEAPLFFLDEPTSGLDRYRCHHPPSFMHSHSSY
jgi:ABC-type multidrug transport system ATPase subunit